MHILIFFLIFFRCTFTTSSFQKELEPELYKMGYIYQKHFKSHQDSINFNHDQTFTCRRMNYEIDDEEIIGYGTIHPDPKGLTLKNVNCLIEPTFNELLCHLDEKISIGHQYIWNCTSENDTKYYFWMISK